MDKFWTGFHKQAGVASRIGGAVGNMVVGAKNLVGRASTTGRGIGQSIQSGVQSIKNAPSQMRNSYRQKMMQAHNQAALANPVQKIRGQFPGGVAPKTPASLKNETRAVRKQEANAARADRIRNFRAMPTTNTMASTKAGKKGEIERVRRTTKDLPPQAAKQAPAQTQAQPSNQTPAKGFDFDQKMQAGKKFVKDNRLLLGGTAAAGAIGLAGGSSTNQYQNEGYQ